SVAGPPSLETPVADAHRASATPAALVPNPGARGPFSTERIEVFRGWERVEVDMPLRVEDLAEVTLPMRDGEVAPGRHPVVLLLHGRHQWCSDVGGTAPDPVPAWCGNPMTTIPVPSYTGYRYLADALASQGRIVISISANGINAQDNTRDLGANARAFLIEYHLDRLRRADLQAITGYGDRLIGHVDLSRTVLMGHSRGGEGVVRAAQVIAQAPGEATTIAGAIPLAPTAFSQSAPPTMTTVTILPACDGDVSDLQGQTYVDRGRDLYGTHGALSSSVWVPGANHNYFNTEWTPGLSVSDTGSDDAEYIYDDTTTTGSCRPAIRMIPALERAVGLQYMAGAVRLMQDGDASMQPLFDGSGAQVASIARTGVTIRSASLAGPDRLALVPDPSTRLEASGASAMACLGSGLGTVWPTRDVCATGVAQSRQDTTWLGSRFVQGNLPGRTAIDVAWTGEGTALADLAAPVSLAGASRVSARVVLDPSSAGTVALALRDADGRVAIAAYAGLPVAPLSVGPVELRLWPQTLWAHPSAFTGIDLSRIAAIGIAAQGSGRAWLVDASRRVARAAPPARPLPVAEVRDYVATVAGGMSTTVPVTIALDRPVPRPAYLRVSVGRASDDSIIAGVNRTVRVTPGTRRVTVPVPVTMPSAVGPGSAATVSVAVYPVSGATVGMFRSTLTVIPASVDIRTLTLPQPNAVASAGGVLQWDFVADRPGRVIVSAALAQAAMDFSDLDPAFLAARGLPTSGPIGSDTYLALTSTQVADNRYRISLPLSATATPGANVTFFVMSVTGAYAPGILAFSGSVA
ncbi:MAG: hypothetical protein ACKOT0_11635, partial [bacterium]